MTLRSTAARVPLDPASTGFGMDEPTPDRTDCARAEPLADAASFDRRLTVFIVVPTLHAGAADSGAIELARILRAAGHRPLVISKGGRLEADVADAGAEFVRLDVASRNPATMTFATFRLARLIRARGCDLIHAHGRTAAWSAYVAARACRVPLLTTWYKGFREQNILKHAYNSVMARGERVIAVSDQIAELVNERHGTPWDRLAVVPASIDLARFDPKAVSGERIAAMRQAFGVGEDTKVILVVGRMLRRKGHHVVVKAVHRLKERGLKDFVCVFAGEDQGRTRYTGELWDLVIATGTADAARLAGAVDDMPAAYAAADVVVSAAVQHEGLQRAILEAQAMARPVVVSDLAAGPEVVLAPPAVPDDRMTGLRMPAADDAALAAALIRLFSASDAARAAIGERGRAWVSAHFNAPGVAREMLGLYAEIARAHVRS